MRHPGFVSPSAPSLSLTANASQAFNFYLEQLPRFAKNQFAYYPSLGFQSFLSVPDIGTRVLSEINGALFGIVGGTAYQFFSNGTSTMLGSVAQDASQAQAVSNGPASAQILFSSGSNGYVYNTVTKAFTQVLTGGCTQVASLAGFGLALNPANSSFQISQINDATTWPGLIVQREDAPDNWQAMIVNIPDLWLIGNKTGVVFYDAGTFPIPFAQRPGATFKYGIVAPWSLAQAGGQVMWLSQNAEGNGIVVLAVGYTPQRVSTHEVETAISGYARTFGISDAEALMFQYQGHVFYVLTFPAANATWVFDITTGVWTNWGKWNSPMTRYDVWRPRVHAEAFGQHFVGDRLTGTIATMDQSYGTELDGTAIRRMIIPPSLFNENRQFTVRRLELLLEAGLGTVGGAGSAPVVAVSVSNDGGKTFGPERAVSAGLTGQYSQRVMWDRFGTFRDFVPKYVMSDPIPWRVIDGYVNGLDPQSGR